MKEGNPERGRTMFEGILRNYPRRTDIWSVYIDQEIKQGDIQRIRALFERATHLDLNAKSMKFLFKRYLDFERSEGDDERIAHVKQRAMEYVSNKFGSAAE
jgi:rRNA biogenesis protein RRP5